MKYNNLFPLKLILKSPVIPIILGIIIFMIYIIYWTPATLCDDNGWYLYELKTQLESEIARYKISNINMDKYTNLKSLLKGISEPNFRNFNLEKTYHDNMIKAVQEHNESITKINKLASYIKKIEPDFKLGNL